MAPTSKHLEVLKKLIEDMDGEINLSEIFQNNDETVAALSFAITEIPRLQAVIDAWHEAFGTTQLTHALCRLETAESKIPRLEKQLFEMEGKECIHPKWEQCGYDKIKTLQADLAEAKQAKDMQHELDKQQLWDAKKRIGELENELLERGERE